MVFSILDMVPPKCVDLPRYDHRCHAMQGPFGPMRGRGLLTVNLDVIRIPCPIVNLVILCGIV